IGKNSFHVVGHDRRGAIVLRQKWSRGQVEARLANLPPCLVGMEACMGAHHLSRKLQLLGHNARLMPATYVRPYSKGQKNDFRDAEAIAEAVQRPTMKFVATKTADQLDLQALHRVRERLVSQRTRIINQIRAHVFGDGVQDVIGLALKEIGVFVFSIEPRLVEMNVAGERFYFQPFLNLDGDEVFIVRSYYNEQTTMREAFKYKIERFLLRKLNEW